ncbi:MAG: SDR family oxidoreductase, partial [Actinobacteria bacterium]|nr:SDR family oxidoreductase [Actinomycetota bacterium]
AILRMARPTGPSTENNPIVTPPGIGSGATMPHVRWQGAHVVVTGGSSGIGEAVAREAAARGARLTLVARGAERLEAAASAIRSSRPGTEVGVAAVDVSDREAIHHALEQAAGERGEVEVLVTSAGITRPGRFLELDDDVFRSMVEVDYFGTLWPVRAVAPAMAARGHGSIVGVSSAAGLVGVYGYSAYGAAKFAVRGLFGSLRTELAPHGVHVGCAFPPDVDTPMLAEEEAFKPAETKAIAGSIEPLSAERVAAAIVAGIERRRPEIYADAQTRALARTVATAPAVYRRLFDRRVRRTD